MSQIYHHLPKLIENSFVIKYGTVKKGGRSTDYYRRVGQVIILEPNPGVVSHFDDEMRERSRKTYISYLKRIQELFKADLSPEEYDTLVDLMVRRDEIENAFYSKIAIREMFAQDIANTYDMMIMQDMLLLYNITNTEWIEINEKLRNIIFKDE